MLVVSSPAAAGWSTPKRVFSDNELEPQGILISGARALLPFERPGDGFAFAPLTRGGVPGRARLSKEIRAAAPGRGGRWLYLHVRFPKDVQDDSECPCRKRIGWSEARSGFGRRHTLTTASAGPVHVAGDRAGNAIIAWTTDTRVLAAYRRAGTTSFSRPREIARFDFVSDIVVAMAGGRFAVLAATTAKGAQDAQADILSGSVRAGVTHRQHVPATIDFLAMRVAVAGDGSVAAAWAGEEGDPFQFAVGRPGADLTALALPQIASSENEPPAVVVGSRGAATALWIDTDAADNSAAYVVSSSSGGAIGAVRSLGAGEGRGTLARRADGTVLAAWPNGGIMSATAGPSRTFGRVRRVHTGEDSEPVAAFDPRSRRPLLAWVRYRYRNPGGPDTLMVSRGTS